VHLDRRSWLRAGACALVLALPAAAEEKKAGEEKDLTKGPPPFESLSFRSIGPAAGGRVSRVAGVPGDPNVYYAATASGGVWKSVDGGHTWKPVFDDQPISSIGSLAIAPSDPNVVYVGSGEANIRGNVAAGNGIYKTVDGGKTWTHVWTQEGQIGTMIVDPRNADVAFAAVLGHAFGPNPERGVYRTRDGGRTWQQVLKKDAETGASDVAFDPSNPHVVFAGLWQARRRPWEMTSGGPGSGLYVSRDGGDTWKQLTGHGLPDGPWGKVGVAVARSDGRRVYALIEAEKGGLFRSDDGGSSWELQSGHHALRQRAWYYTTLTVDPRNPDVVWFPQVPLLKTIDGGRTIRSLKGPHHGDHHDVWIDPKDPRRMADANDGGIDVSVDGGETWFAPPLPISQFYHVAVDTAVPYHVFGAMQDLGTARGPSNSLSRAGIRRAEWQDVGGGEAGHVVADPSDPNVLYAGEYGGYISHFDVRTGQARNVSVYPENPSGHGAEDLKYRFQWTAPIATSPHDPKVVYHGGNVLFRSTDRGQTWTAISGDLTRNDKTKQRWSGGPITGDNTGVEVYDTIFAIAESPRQKDLVWVGSDDGLVHVTRDGGKTWTNVTPKGAPEWGTVSLVEPSPHDAATAYVVFDNHRLDDMRPYLYQTTDAGKTWTSLAKGLPQDVYLHAVREDPKKRGVLYAGTERGVSFSTDAGATWRALRLGLPTVAVHDLVVKDDDLVVGTHGRSLWILDDLTALREITPAVQQTDVVLFPTRPAVRWRYRRERREAGAGQNPPRGATIDYYLRGKVETEMSLDILDESGRVVRTLKSVAEPPEAPEGDPDGYDDPPKPALARDPGVQRAVWDLTYEGAPRVKDAKLDAGDPKDGPMAPPGRYTARLTAAGKTYTTPLVVTPDPRLSLSASDYAEQLRVALEAREALTRLVQGVERLRSVRTQVKGRLDLWKGDPRAADLVKAGDALVAHLDALEEKMHNPKAEVVYDILAQKGGARLYSRLSPLYATVIEADGPPTQGMRETYAAQRAELDALLAEEQRYLTDDLGALNRLAKEKDLGGVLVPEPPR
jgi:photosystem II stability/assembly factor-like uncharacterized protein